MEPGCNKVATGTHSRFNLKPLCCAAEKVDADCPIPCALQMLSHQMKSNLCLKRGSTSCTEGSTLWFFSLRVGCQHSAVFKRLAAAGSAWCHRGPGVKLCTRVMCGSFPNPRARPSVPFFGRGLCGAARLRCAPAALVSWQCRLVSRLCGVCPCPGHPLLPALAGFCFPWRTFPGRLSCESFGGCTGELRKALELAQPGTSAAQPRHRIASGCWSSFSLGFGSG